MFLAVIRGLKAQITPHEVAPMLEQELRNRSEQFETLINRAPLGVYLVDAGLIIRQVNPMALPMFGSIEGGVLNRDFAEIIHLLVESEYADEVVRIFRHTLENGESYVAPERARYRIDRGVTEYWEWRLDRITQPDGSYGLVCYIRDISSQVAARQSLEESREALHTAERLKDEFLATLAHELRNPLAPIRNALRVLQLADADGAVSERTLEMMERQVSHMVRLVDDLLEVSRITRGKIELRQELVNVAEVVRSAIETSRPLIEAGKHQLTVQLDESLPLNADPLRIAQVLSNLLNNAAKYTPAGGRIWLTARREAGRAMISVRDSGAGIPREALPNIFDLFMQVGRTYDRAQGGLGMGLTLVRSLVRMHGGTVQALSAGPGKGSEFIVRLPLAAAEHAQRIGERRTPPAVVRKRILVVDDSRDGADSLGMLLKFLGAEVHLSYDGPSALAALDTFRPMVVLLDIGLPGMDGFEVGRRMRQHPDGAGLCLIALSGWGRDEDRRRSKEAGFDHHLIKPVDPGVLEQLLSSQPAKREEPVFSAD